MQTGRITCSTSEKSCRMVWLIIALVAAALAIGLGAYHRSQGTGRDRSARRLKREQR
jgi:hypothetical protein